MTPRRGDRRVQAALSEERGGGGLGDRRSRARRSAPRGLLPVIADLAVIPWTWAVAR